MKYTVMVRKNVTVNDDSHNRWYWGAVNKVRMEIIEHPVCSYNTYQDAQEAVSNFAAINPGRDYRIEVKR